MIIRTKIQDKKVELHCRALPIGEKNPVGFDVVAIKWEGRDNEKIEPDKGIKLLLDYIDSAVFELPPYSFEIPFDIKEKL